MLQVCTTILNEFIDKCDSLDQIIISDFDKSKSIQLMHSLNKINIDSRASIATTDLKELSELFVIISAYTAPFFDTKNEFSASEIYSALDEFIDFANSEPRLS